MDERSSSMRPQEEADRQMQDLLEMYPADAAKRPEWFSPLTAQGVHAPSFTQVEASGDGYETRVSSRAPFQFSTSLPALSSAQAKTNAFAPVSEKKRRSRARLPQLGLIAVVVMVCLGAVWMALFGAPTSSLATQSLPSTVVPTRLTTMVTATPTPHPTHKATATPQSTATATPPPTTMPQPTEPSSTAPDWVPSSLPAEWAKAGLTMSDLLLAERTAWLFTDREEGVDFRNIGTREHHSGTLTGATYFLTAGGLQRFTANDRRVANNSWYDHIVATKWMQTLVSVYPHPVKLQVQGKRTLAWVDVAFQLYVSQLDPADPQRQKRVGTLEINPKTQLLWVHHMSVLLVRVDPATQGDDPLGGTGWLVSNYGLDQAAPVAVIEPV